jgi:cysteinyl-tRNA synthetase
MSSFPTQASEATEQYLSAVSKVQDASLEVVSTFTANLPEAAKNLSAQPATDLPTAEEITAAYFDFTEKLIANQKAYIERFFAAASPAS